MFYAINDNFKFLMQSIKKLIFINWPIFYMLIIVDSEVKFLQIF